MPRPRNHAKHITSSINDLLKAVTALVGSVHGGVTSSAAVRSSAAEVGESAGRVKAAASAKSVKLRRALRAYWKRMKGKARQQRIAKMLKGRGITVAPKVRKARRAPAGKRAVKARPKARANSWAKMTPEERAARIAKMQAGRKPATA